MFVERLRLNQKVSNDFSALRGCPYILGSVRIENQPKRSQIIWFGRLWTDGRVSVLGTRDHLPDNRFWGLINSLVKTKAGPT
jgi:hypothetical protein